MVWSVFAAAAGVITFLFFAQYARKEIAPGYLAPVSGTARVYAPQPGTISIVHVRQGDMVEKGQPLLTVLTSQIGAGGEDINANMLNALETQKQTLTRTIDDDVHRMDAERQDLTEKVQEHESVVVQINSEQMIQQKRIAILASMVEVGAQLRAKGLASEIDQKHRQEALLDAQQALLKLFQQATTRKGELAEVRSKLEQLPLTLGDRIQTLRNELSATERKRCGGDTLRRGTAL
jgi:membrane fusion protein